MSPLRVASVVLVETLLEVPRCLSIRIEDTHFLDEFGKGEDVTPEVVEAAAAGMQLVDETSCSTLTSATAELLANLDWEFRTLFPDSSTGWTHPMTDDETELVHNISSSLATTVMALDEKHCLKEAMDDENVQREITALNRHRMNLMQNSLAPRSNPRMRIAFTRLASWQEALVDLGASMVGREELYPRDVADVYSCPQPCTKCSLEHNSLFKEAEADKFKCILTGSNRHMPPSRADTRFSCSKSKRRISRPWQFKTWCTVPGWIMDSYQNARIAAMVTCGTHSLLAALRTNEVMSGELMKACMLAEQRMVVTIPQLKALTEFMAAEDDGVVPMGLQYAFGVYVTTATAQGLVALRDSSMVAAPSNDSWTELLVDRGYTLLPPGLVPSVSCKPPVNRWEFLIGLFAAVVGIGVGIMGGILASIPALLLSGFFFICAGIFLVSGFVFVPLWLPGGQLALLGFTSLASIPKMFVEMFHGVSKDVYNALTPVSTKDCPRGLLFLSGTSPMCIQDMDRLEAKRYPCPMDESRAVVVSCEPEFNGLLAIRGEPCPA